MGSAEKARNAPNRKGENRGKKNRIVSQIRKKLNNRVDILGVPGRKNETSFRRGKYRGCFFENICYNTYEKNKCIRVAHNTKKNNMHDQGGSLCRPNLSITLLKLLHCPKYF